MFTLCLLEILIRKRGRAYILQVIEKYKKMVGTAGFEQSLLRLAQLGQINILLIYTPKGGVSRKFPNMPKNYDLFNENNGFRTLWEVLI